MFWLCIAVPDKWLVHACTLMVWNTSKVSMGCEHLCDVPKISRQRYEVRDLVSWSCDACVNFAPAVKEHPRLAGFRLVCWLGITSCDPSEFLLGKASNVKWPKVASLSNHIKSIKQIQTTCSFSIASWGSWMEMSSQLAAHNLPCRGSALPFYAFFTKIRRMGLEAVQLQIQRLGCSQLSHSAQTPSTYFGPFPSLQIFTFNSLRHSAGSLAFGLQSAGSKAGGCVKLVCKKVVCGKKWFV